MEFWTGVTGPEKLEKRNEVSLHLFKLIYLYLLGNIIINWLTDCIFFLILTGLLLIITYIIVPYILHFFFSYFLYKLLAFMMYQYRKTFSYLGVTNFISIFLFGFIKKIIFWHDQNCIFTFLSQRRVNIVRTWSLQWVLSKNHLLTWLGTTYILEIHIYMYN